MNLFQVAAKHLIIYLSLMVSVQLHAQEDPLKSWLMGKDKITSQPAKPIQSSNWVTILGQAFPPETYSQDSIQIEILKKEYKIKNAEINTKLEEMGYSKGKDPFETTQDYEDRKAKIAAYKKTLISNIIDPIHNKMEEYRNKLYRTSIATDTKILLSLSKYNADESSWDINFNYKSVSNSIKLNIIPDDAKVLWENRENMRIMQVRNRSGILQDIFEVSFGSNMQNSFFILKTDSQTKDVIAYLKNNSQGNEEDKIYQKVEIDAEFPGGSGAWFRYVSREIERNMDVLQDDKRSGTTVVIFIVDREGNVSNVRTMNCNEAGVANCLGQGTKLAEIAVAAIIKGPKWKPAIQNGRTVRANRRQPVTFKLEEE